MFKDYYSILEISQNATEQEIKKAFRELAIKWHPDRNIGIDTTLKMQEINEAYLILKDKEARERYDLEYKKFKQYKEDCINTKTEKEYNYSDFVVDDDLLKKWMENAKKQSVELARQAIKDFKGVSKAATDGCLNGISQAIIWIVVINIIFFLIKMCSE